MKNISIRGSTPVEGMGRKQDWAEGEAKTTVQVQDIPPSPWGSGV